MYAEAIREICQLNTNTLLVDLWVNSYGVDGITKDDLNDGLHLGPGGNQKVYKKVLGILEQKHIELVPACIPGTNTCTPVQEHYPTWNELSSLTPEEIESKIMNWKYNTIA